MSILFFTTIINCMINATSDVNFTGRCPAIRQGQWASHIVNAYFPHESVTRYEPLLNSTMERTKIKEPYLHDYRLYPQKVLDAMNKLRIMNFKTQSVREAYVSTPKDGSYRNAVSSIDQLIETHIGNCHENAIAAETILRANGVKNPAVAPIYMGDHSVDHVVCVFNRDGSKVKTIENNNTIIVDPWMGIVDFANNAIVKYKTLLNKYVAKGKDGKATIPRIYEHPMTNEDIKTFNEIYPEFVQKKRPD